MQEPPPNPQRPRPRGLLHGDEGAVHVLDRQAGQLGCRHALSVLMRASRADADASLEQIAGHPRDDGAELVRGASLQEARDRSDLGGPRPRRLELVGNLDDLV